MQRAPGEFILMSNDAILHVDLRVARRGVRVRAVMIRLQRPDIAVLLIGCAPPEAIERVARLHASCGAAHRLAALRAVTAAGGRVGADDCAPAGASAAAGGLTVTERAVLQEIAGEHLLRLYMDWPMALGLAAQPAVVRQWRGRLRQEDPAIAAADVDAVLRQGVLLVNAAPKMAGITTRLRRRVRKTVACLMAIKLAARCPGKIRQWIAPSAAQVQSASVVARHAEQGGHWGAGVAMTARGTLIHRVRLQRDASGCEVIGAWSMDAPTDRLFVDDGAVARALEGLQADGLPALRRLAALTVLSFDPCFECRIALVEVGEDDA